MNKRVFIIVALGILGLFSIFYLKRTTVNPKVGKNTIIVGTNAEYAPFSFQENNTIIGFDIDLIQEIAKRLGKTIELQDMPFDALIPALQMGAIHVIAAGITPTPERAQRIIFTKPYLQNDPLLIVSNTAKPITTLEQLSTKKVGVNEGFTADYYMSKIECPELIRFASAMELFMALESNRVDAIVAARNSIQPLIAHYGAQKFIATPIADTSDEYALAISKKYPELLEPIQKILDEIAIDGTIDALKKRWPDLK